MVKCSPASKSSLSNSSPSSSSTWSEVRGQLEFHVQPTCPTVSVGPVSQWTEIPVRRGKGQLVCLHPNVTAAISPPSWNMKDLPCLMGCWLVIPENRTVPPMEVDTSTMCSCNWLGLGNKTFVSVGSKGISALRQPSQLLKRDSRVSHLSKPHTRPPFKPKTQSLESLRILFNKADGIARL